MSRSLGRNAHIYNSNDPATELGGLVLTNGITNANFYSMVEIICIFDCGYFIRDLMLNMVTGRASKPRIHSLWHTKVTGESTALAVGLPSHRLPSLQDLLTLHKTECY